MLEDTVQPDAYVPRSVRLKENGVVDCHEKVLDSIDVGDTLADASDSVWANGQFHQNWCPFPELLVIEVSRKASDNSLFLEAVDTIRHRRRRSIDGLGDVTIGAASVLDEEFENLSVDVVEIVHIRLSSSSPIRFRLWEPNKYVESTVGRLRALARDGNIHVYLSPTHQNKERKRRSRRSHPTLTMSYEFGDAVPAQLPSSVKPGTNVLVTGPAMSGKRALMLDILARGANQGDGAVVVTANDGGATINEQFRSRVSLGETYFRIIDTVGSNPEGELADVIHTCSSPGDLTGIGIEFSQISKEANTTGVDRVRLAFDSLSPLLMYVELERLFRFLHVFTQQIQSNDWLGLFAIDPESHDKQTINTINQLFDGMLELRDDGDRREIRARGFGEAPTGWVAFD